MNRTLDHDHVVIVGAGQTGGAIAIELRKLRYPGRITMIGQEAYPPYQRPPLSKAYLAGDMTREKLLLIPEQRLDAMGIEFVGGTDVLSIDRQRKSVLLADGRSIPYGRLALATGGQNRQLPLPGADRPNVLSLRTIEDTDRILLHWKPGARLAIVGGGFIGLEVAAAAARAGLQVTVLEAMPQILSRVTVPEVSRFFEQEHRAAGVTIKTSANVVGLEGIPNVSQVLLEDGSRIDVDLVLVGIGLSPNTHLAEDSGLECGDGIIVDEFAQTSDPHIVAAGDCANHPSAYAQRRLRLESVQNATDQARTAAATLCGQLKSYNAIPWFWSDQYDLKLQTVGLCAGHDCQVMRGNPASRSFSMFYFIAGRLIAADNVNRVQEHMWARRLIAQGARLDLGRVANESIDLREAVRTP